jgi:CRISPR-associated exonuclease Cas4
MIVLGIEQREEERHLVNKGRMIHDLKLVINKDYLRSKIGAVDKIMNLYLSSDKLRLVGKMDELLFLNDDTIAPLDYKYAFWEEKIYNTYKMQQTLYALLAEEHFSKSVDYAFLVYTRSKNHLVKINVTSKMKMEAMKTLDRIFEIINLSMYPEGTKQSSKCLDCTYRNICSS